MKTLKPLSIAAFAAGLSACAGMPGIPGLGGNAAPSDSGVAAGAAAQPVSGEYKGPSSNLVVEAGRPEHLSTGNVLIVPTVYVSFPVAGKVGVSQSGSAWATIGGGSANTVKASAQFTVNGLDKALAQQIAKQVYDDLIAQLRATGYTVLSYEDIKDRDVLRKASRKKPDADWGLPTDKTNGITTVQAAPSDEQNFEWGFNGGVFNQFISLGKTKLTDGILMIPEFTITAPQMWGEKGEGYSTISAAVKGAPAMQMTVAGVSWLTNKPKVEMGGGPRVGVHMKGVVGLSDKVGELKMLEDTTSGAANAISKTLGFLSGTGSITSQSASYTMTIDREAYVAAAVGGMRKFNAEVAKVAAKQKPSS